MKKSNKAVILFLSIIFMLLMCASGYVIWEQLNVYRQGDYFYEQMEAYYNGKVQPEMEEEAGTVEEQDSNWPDFQELRQINPDIGAWIMIPDTKINYPVMYPSDNDYYLNHLPDGEANKNGSIFVDAYNKRDFADRNTILYGHHMKSGSMFAGLMNYQEQEYFHKHSMGYLYTEDTAYDVEFFAGFVTSDLSDVYDCDFSSTEEYIQWLERCKNRADVPIEVDVSGEDHVITLSTCEYSRKNGRYVLMGKLIPR